MRPIRCVPLCVRSRKSTSSITCARCAYRRSISPAVASGAVRVSRTTGARARTEQLVGHDLHRHREIQRQVLGVRRNADQHVRRFELLVREPGALGAEQHGDRRRAALPSTMRSRGIAHVAARGSSGPARARWWRRRSRSPPSASATVSTTRARASRSSAPEARAVASACGNCFGCTSTSSLERHVLHGARDRPDVARVRGLDENDADRDGSHGRVESRYLLGYAPCRFTAAA